MINYDNLTNVFKSVKTIDKITGINISYYISKTNYKDSPFFSL